MSDDQLWEHAVRLAAEERAKTFELVEVLAAMDARDLPRKRNRRSLFEVCTTTLRLSEAAAFRRIRAARALQAFPPIGPLLRAGELSLETIALLHPHIDKPYYPRLVAESRGKRAWQVEQLVAAYREPAPARAVVRFLPAPPEMAAPFPNDALPLADLSTASSPSVSPAPPPDAQPALPADAPITPPQAIPMSTPSKPPSEVQGEFRPSARIAFTADPEFLGLLEQATAAMRHKYPDGCVEGVLKDALVALLRYKRPWAAPAKPRMPLGPWSRGRDRA